MFRLFRKAIFMGERFICRSCQHKITSRSFIGSFLVASVPVVNQAKSEFGNLEPPDPNKLTHTYIIKNASVLTIDAATALLTQSITALLDITEQYQDALQRIQKLLDLQLAVMGDTAREAKVCDTLIAVRSQLAELRQQKQDLEYVYASAASALQAAADAAHSTGAEYASVAAVERIYSASTYLEQRKTEVEAEEARLRITEAKCVEEMYKKAKELEKMKVKDTENQVETDTEMQKDSDEYVVTFGKDLDDLETVVEENSEENLGST